MNRLVKAFISLVLIIPIGLSAQQDSIRLICPLDEAIVVPPPKNVLKMEDPDYCISLTSVPDTVVKAVASGRITNVEFDDETKNGVVIFARLNNKDYYFWYTGMNKLAVRKNELIKQGQPIGFISPGEKIEMTMYQFETPIDPTKYLNCKNVILSN